MTKNLVVTFWDVDGQLITSELYEDTLYSEARKAVRDVLETQDVGATARIDDGGYWELWRSCRVVLTETYPDTGTVAREYEDIVVRCNETGRHSLVVRHG